MNFHSEALHFSAVTCLTAILGGHGQERKSAELEIKALEVTDEFGLVLTQITASVDSPVELRQLASILLKQYVEIHWSRELDKFEEPEPSQHVKEEIRKLLPVCLRDSHSKVRATVAYAISAIAALDWPEEWKDLFDELMCALSSNETDLVHGAMRVLSEFCHQVSDTQVPHVVPLVFPYLLKVIVQPELYSARTRARAVHIFNTLTLLVYSMSGQYQNAPDSLLFPILSEYLKAFVELLGNSHHGNDDPGLRREIVMALCQLLQYFPHALNPHIMTLVTPIWNILVSSAESYVNGVVNCTDTVTAVCDSDGEVIGQETTIFAIFEFVSALSESSFARHLLPPTLPELVYYLIAYMQITEEQVTVWSDDVTRFVEDDENEFSYSVRLSALDLLLGICVSPKLGVACCSAITAAVEKHIQETPLSCPGTAWKVHEACMLAISCALQAVSTGHGAFDCQTFSDRVLVPDITSNSSSFLTGRCLWLASKMSHALKEDTLIRLLELVATGLGSVQPRVVRVLSAKATYYFCSNLKTSEHAQVLSPFIPHYLHALAEMASEFSDDVVSLAVDSLQLIAQIDPLVTAQYANQLVPLATSLFLKYAHDPSVSMSVEELFQALGQNPGCHGYLQTRFLPTAVEILQSGGSQLPLGLVPTVLDVLVHIVRGAGPHKGTLVTDVFPAVIQRVLTSDDSAILQNGGECVRAYISTCMEELATWCDNAGHSGLQYVMKVILHLLDPKGPEFSASFVGRLIISFVKKAGSILGDHLEILLRSILSKMQSVASLPVMQSLLVVFACLMETELESVVTFLSSVPDPTGQPALNFVMREWLSRHSSFYGGFEPRMSSLALTKVLTHTLSTNDQRLGTICVREEEVSPPGMTGIITRSQKSQMPVEWSEVPLPIKIVKLLLGDVANGLELSHPAESEDGSDEEEETLETTLDSMLSYSSYEVEEDPDLVNEPVLQLDLQGYLVSYLRDLSQQQCFITILPHLSVHEVYVFRRVGIHIP